MKAFQCSICKQLDINDTDDKAFCRYGIDARQKYRDKADKEECLKCFEEVESTKMWGIRQEWKKLMLNSL
ncbi:hypothetical protein [Clostridium sp.]|uniref:hypothetical protein n=1 Tax=Clostridium sp. TaxID=1506 RepID=UPI001A4CAE7D|nr:hypothetical protein [Clostridium sp.]MBK5242138.1 hypothetical protein [Clostridium sp.]